jgi:hypothetical protein
MLINETKVGEASCQLRSGKFNLPDELSLQPNERDTTHFGWLRHACYNLDMGDAAARRARARRRWPVVLSSLRNQPSDDLSSSTTLEERIAMMRPLAEAAWRVAGLPLPRYRRSRIPVRLLVRRDGEETETPLPRRR